MADEGFLQRWSRRKAEARAPLKEPEPAQDPTPEPAEVPEAPDPQAPSTETRAGDVDAAVDLDALPDIDTLTYQSDFTVFMRKGVPPELRKRALQRLWRSNPTLANLDGLVEYGKDYTQIGMTREIVRTAYRVGRGMLERIEAQPPSAAPAPPDAATVADPQHVPAPAQADPEAIAGGGAHEPVAATDRQESAPGPGRGDQQRERAHPTPPRPLPKRG